MSVRQLQPLGARRQRAGPAEAGDLSLKHFSPRVLPEKVCLFNTLIAFLSGHLHQDPNSEFLKQFPCPGPVICFLKRGPWECSLCPSGFSRFSVSSCTLAR